MLERLFFGPASGPMSPFDWLILIAVVVFALYMVAQSRQRP